MSAGLVRIPDHPRLERYSLEQALTAFPDVARLKVCFLPAVSGDSDIYIVKFYRAMNVLGAEGSRVSFFPLTTNLRERVLSSHVIYVSGGNTKAMFMIWREWKLDHILREALEAGTILTGLSAGSICWFEEGVSDSVEPGKLAPLRDCLGFLPGSHCPHYDGEVLRRPTYRKMVSESAISNGYAINDGAAIHYIDGNTARVVSSRPNAKAYRVERSGDSSFAETELPGWILLSDQAAKF